MCVLSLTCFVHIGFPSFVGFDGILFSFNSSFLISFSCFVTSSSSVQEIKKARILYFVRAAFGLFNVVVRFDLVNVCNRANE